MSTLAAYTVTHNTNRIAYPWRESITSSLALADRVFVCDADSTDGTWEELQDWSRREPRLEIMRHPWGKHYTILPTICNGILENPTLKRMDWSIQVQADEVVADWTIETTRRWLDSLPDSAVLAAPYYRHFCPDPYTTWPFIYDRKAVLMKNNSGIRWDVGHGGDACSLVGAEWYQAPLDVFHYGKVQTGREHQALIKEVTMQEMYRDMGFPDPKVVAQVESGLLDYRKIFDNSLFTPYSGRHPYYARQWVQQRGRI